MIGIKVLLIGLGIKEEEHALQEDAVSVMTGAAATTAMDSAFRSVNRH